MGGHGAPRPTGTLLTELLPVLRRTHLGTVITGGIGLLAAAATALSAFATTQVDRLDEKSGQLQDGVGRLSTGLETTRDRLTGEVRASTAELDELQRLLRELEQDAPVTQPAPAEPREAPSRPTKATRKTSTVQPPGPVATPPAQTAAQARNPLEEFCAQTQLCNPQEGR